MRLYSLPALLDDDDDACFILIFWDEKLLCKNEEQIEGKQFELLSKLVEKFSVTSVSALKRNHILSIHLWLRWQFTTLADVKSPFGL